MHARSILLGAVLALGLLLVAAALGLVDLGEAPPRDGPLPGLMGPGATPTAVASSANTPSIAPTPPTECPAALLEGVLAMDPHGGLGIAAETGEVQPVRWPPTFSTRVTGDVVVLFDETEAEVARTGDRVSVGGGMTPEGDEWVVCPWEVTRSDR